MRLQACEWCLIYSVYIACIKSIKYFLAYLFIWWRRHVLFLYSQFSNKIFFHSYWMYVWVKRDFCLNINLPKSNLFCTYQFLDAHCSPYVCCYLIFFFQFFKLDLVQSPDYVALKIKYLFGNGSSDNKCFLVCFYCFIYLLFIGYIGVGIYVCIYKII